jgi:hypothetical protein
MNGAIARYSSTASSATGLMVILGWLMTLVANELRKIGLDMPLEVQFAIVGLIVGPLIKWLHQAGIDVGYSSPAEPPPGTLPPPTAAVPLKP